MKVAGIHPDQAHDRTNMWPETRTLLFGANEMRGLFKTLCVLLFKTLSKSTVAAGKAPPKTSRKPSVETKKKSPLETTGETPAGLSSKRVKRKTPTPPPSKRSETPKKD
ncbi:hypothetical protein RB195_010622 [Necator americanus]|uniref:Uncharacterized protein n=1 Tax=Necator americanus TaxID=51031 RepID=A0ABR1CZK5_NECAM